MTDGTVNKPHSFVIHLTDEERDAMLSLRDMAGLSSLPEVMIEAVNVYNSVIGYAALGHDIVAVPNDRKAMREILSDGIRNAYNSWQSGASPTSKARVTAREGNVITLGFDKGV